MPIARKRALKTVANARSLSRMRYFGGAIPGKRLGDLPRKPLGCRVSGVAAQNSTGQRREAGDFHEPTVPSRVMVTILRAVVSIIAFRFRGRAALELKLIALQHQLAVLHRQRRGRPQLSPLDRLLWALLYRIWPPIIDGMVLVKPATVIEWHRKGFRFYWRWRSRRQGRPRISPETRFAYRYGE